MCRFEGEGQGAKPTHDTNGNELSPEALKKGKAAADKARKSRAFYDKQIAEKGSNFLNELQQEIQQMTVELEELGVIADPQENDNAHPT